MTKKPVDRALNDFLDYMTSEKVGGGICLREKVRVYVPTCYDPATKKHRCAVEAERVRLDLTKLFEGSTTWSGTGGWWDKKNKKMWDEPVIVIESAHKPLCEKEAKIFVNIIQNYASKAKQETVSIEGGFTDFYIGTGEKFKPKYIEYGKMKKRR